MFQADYSGAFKDLNLWMTKNPQLYMEGDKCSEALMRETNFAFLTELTEAEELQKNACLQNKSLIILKDRFFSGYFSLAFQKNAPFNTLISTQYVNSLCAYLIMNILHISIFSDFRIAEIIETGLMDVWYKNYSTKMPFCYIYQPDILLDFSSQGLKMNQIGGAFILLATGIIFSWFFFVLEIPTIQQCIERKVRNYYKKRTL